MKYIGVAYIIIFVYSYYLRRIGRQDSSELSLNICNKLFLVYIIWISYQYIIFLLDLYQSEYWYEAYSFYTRGLGNFIYLYLSYLVFSRLLPCLFIFRYFAIKISLSFIILLLSVLDIISLFKPEFSIENTFLNLATSDFLPSNWAHQWDYPQILLENTIFLALWAFIFWLIKQGWKNKEIDIEKHLIE